MGVKLAVGEPQSVAMAKVHEELAGPGLVIVLTVGGAGALVLLPNSSGLIPAWAAEPDATGKAKLTTLAQELGMLLLPEEFMPEDFAASCVGNLSQALMAGEAAADAAIVPLELHKDGKREGHVSGVAGGQARSRRGRWRGPAEAAGRTCETGSGQARRCRTATGPGQAGGRREQAGLGCQATASDVRTTPPLCAQPDADPRAGGGDPGPEAASG